MSKHGELEECKQFSQITMNRWNIQQSKGNAWTVHLHGKIIDIVWFEAECKKDFVKKYLVQYDGYSENIEVYRPM